jgi:hypothetical protein
MYVLHTYDVDLDRACICTGSVGHCACDVDAYVVHAYACVMSRSCALVYVQVSHSAELRKAPLFHKILYFGMLYLGAIVMSIIGGFEHTGEGHEGHAH